LKSNGSKTGAGIAQLITYLNVNFLLIVIVICDRICSVECFI